MAITVGKRLGPYEILSQIGEGGMGEVYKARDTRLDRIVAIKVLPAHLANVGEARERFEREAHTIANLNHPHICVLHDIGCQDGIDYLVMEYLEGETLYQRLQKGPLPLEQVLEYAIQIADALDKAHHKGVTHRDIKPGNIMLTKTDGTKLLDFGLAKLKQEVARAITPASEFPTVPGVLTVHGTLLGTLQYMAPEQVEGKTDEIDGRTDIFAFGAVVYEMATGKRAFEGENTASVIAKILDYNPPPMSTFQPMTPPALERVVNKCLAKEQEDRWQSARDLRDELKWIKEASSQVGMPAPVIARRKTRERLVWAMGTTGLLLAILVILFVYSRRSLPPAPQRMIFSVSPPQNATFAGTSSTTSVALSPDGTQLAFRALEAGVAKIFVRPLDLLEAQAVPGTEGVDDRPFFWSPDSRSLGFSAEGKLKKVEAAGGPAQVLALLASTFWGGTWNAEGTIVFSEGGTMGISRISAAGGDRVQIARPDNARGELLYEFPCFLPDGRHFLYTVTSTAGQPDVGGIYAGSLDSKESKRILGVVSQTTYIPPGYLLYVRDGTLMAHSFDGKRLELSGDPFPIAEQVSFNPGAGYAAFSASENGVLAYRPGSSTAISQLTWFDRSGRQLGTVGPPGVYLNPNLSPDGKRVAVEQFASGSRDIWIVDVERGSASRFTFNSAPESDPLWSPNGESIVYALNNNIYQKPSSGAGSEEVLLKNAVGTSIWDWSSDGRYIAYRPLEATDIWFLPLFGDRKPFGLMQTEYNEILAQISPNGIWIAYASNESGRYELYVQSFPNPGGKWQVTSNGGLFPRWRRDGKELFYMIPADQKLMAVPVRGGESLEMGTPQALFETRTVEGAATRPGLLQQYDVSPDGQRFLMNVPVGGAATSPSITVVLHWLAGLKKK